MKIQLKFLLCLILGYFFEGVTSEGEVNDEGDGVKEVTTSTPLPGEEAEGEVQTSIINLNATSTDIEEAKTSKKALKKAGGVLGSYLTGLGTQSLQNTVDKIRPPPPSITRTPVYNGGAIRRRRTRPPTPPPYYGQNQETDYEYQTTRRYRVKPRPRPQQQLPPLPPPLPPIHQQQQYVPPITTNVPLRTEEQKLAYQYLQLLQEQDRVQAQAPPQVPPQIQQSKPVPQQPSPPPPPQVPFVAPATTPQEYDYYDPDEPTTTRPPLKRRRRRSTTTTPASPQAQPQPDGAAPAPLLQLPTTAPIAIQQPQPPVPGQYPPYQPQPPYYPPPSQQYPPQYVAPPYQQQIPSYIPPQQPQAQNPGYLPPYNPQYPGQPPAYPGSYYPSYQPQPQFPYQPQPPLPQQPGLGPVQIPQGPPVGPIIPVATTPAEYDYYDAFPDTTTPLPTPPPPPPNPSPTPKFTQEQLLRLQQIKLILELQRLRQLNETGGVNATTSTTTEDPYEFIPRLVINPYLAPTKLTTTTDNPNDAVQDLANLFGSLAVGNLAGVVDGTLKLAGTGVFNNLNTWTACQMMGRCDPEDESLLAALPGHKPAGAVPQKPIPIPHPPQHPYPGRKPVY